MALRDYQVRSIDQLYDWFRLNKEGNPCLVLPTGAGKSWIIAQLCKDALANWPETRILMMSHQKELIEQDAEKLRLIWPNAPMGIYSASIGKRQMGQPITFAGIQSVRDKAERIGHIDLIIIDECHLVSHKAEGGYRTLIADLQAINPALRVIGLTASPWRLGHGEITEGDALFDDLIEPVTIEELIYKGFLAPLHSKITDAKLSVEGVHKRGGEYIESELQAAVDKDDLNQAVAKEIMKFAGDRRSWLLFCTGVDHSYHMRDALRELGVVAETITGKTAKLEREQIIADFKAGKIRALTNANVLTTGFDAPDTDLIALLRPTMSPVLYLQMAGRGLRPKSHTDHCLVLDFAGAVQTHGPITAVKAPNMKGEGNGEAPVKLCDGCGELVHPTIRVCPVCGFEFPAPEKPKPKLHDDDIMGKAPIEMPVKSWQWAKHISRNSGNEMVKVGYRQSQFDKPIYEYFVLLHQNPKVRERAARSLFAIADEAGVQEVKTAQSMEAIADFLNQWGKPPTVIKYRMEGDFPRIIAREWNENERQESMEDEYIEDNIIPF